MSVKSYRLKFAHDGYEFEVEGDKAFVMEMLQRFGPQAGQDQWRTKKGKGEEKQEGKKNKNEIQTTKSISIREFIQKLSFTNHTDIALAFGYYLEKHSSVSEFTPADINNCYYEAKMEASNTSQMIIRNIKRGYIMPSKNKGAKGRNLYTLTSTGETFIKKRLQDN